MSTKRRTTAKQRSGVSLRRLEKRLAAYAMAAGAALAAGADRAEAASIPIKTPADAPFTIGPNTEAGELPNVEFHVNPLEDSIADFFFQFNTDQVSMTPNKRQVGGTIYCNTIMKGGQSYTAPVLALGPNTQVDAEIILSKRYYRYAYRFYVQPGPTGPLGVYYSNVNYNLNALRIAAPSDPSNHYIVAHFFAFPAQGPPLDPMAFFDVFVNVDGSVTINAAGMNPGISIVTPADFAVPEPASVSLLALGAVGLAAFRRRRRA